MRLFSTHFFLFLIKPFHPEALTRNPSHSKGPQWTPIREGAAQPRPRSPLLVWLASLSKKLGLLVGLLGAFVLAGCNFPKRPAPQAQGGEDPAAHHLRILTTTTLVADLARSIAGPYADVESLMGPGVDPHLYQASAQDAARLRSAQVVLYNGLMLEGKMGELLTRLGQNSDSHCRVYAISNALAPSDLIYPQGPGKAHPDPHIWFDARLWAQCGQGLAQFLAEACPAGREHFFVQAKDLAARCEALHSWVLSQVEQVPKARRVLITSHDAFNYLGRAYGVEVVGVQGISTSAQAGMVEMTAVADLIRQRRLPAIFVENSVSAARIQRIAADTQVRIGGELYSDSLGAATPEGPPGIDTWEGMMRYNIGLIVAGLSAPVPQAP